MNDTDREAIFLASARLESLLEALRQSDHLVSLLRDAPGIPDRLGELARSADLTDPEAAMVALAHGVNEAFLDIESLSRLVGAADSADEEAVARRAIRREDVQDDAGAPPYRGGITNLPDPAEILEKLLSLLQEPVDGSTEGGVA